MVLNRTTSHRLLLPGSRCEEYRPRSGFDDRIGEDALGWPGGRWWREKEVAEEIPPYYVDALTNVKPGFLSMAAHFGLLLITPFLVFCTLLMMGIVLYLSLEEPGRLAGRFVVETNSLDGVSVSRTNFVLLSPQPLQVSTSESNVCIIHPAFDVVLSRSAMKTAIWGNGLAFESGRQAAWHLSKAAWPLYSLTAAGLLFLWCRARGSRKRELSPQGVAESRQVR